MMYKYKVYFTNGNCLSFGFSQDIDLHDLKNVAIATDDIYINLQNVNFIKKEVENNDSK